MRSVLVGMLLVGLLAASGSKNEARITGYPIGRSAVEGEIKQQLNVVAERIAKELLREKSDQLAISIVGYADVTGSGPGNDDLGSKRASNAGGFLKGRFPMASVNAYSEGSEINARMAIVSWSIVAPAAANKPKQDRAFGGISLIMLGVLLLVSLGLFVWFTTTERSQQTVPLIESPSQPKSAETGSWDIVEASGLEAGILFLVPIWREDGWWRGPIEEKDKRLKKNDMVKSIRGRVKDPDYQSKIATLVAKREIREVQKKGKGTGDVIDNDQDTTSVGADVA